jgi:hypothetical protein
MNWIERYKMTTDEFIAICNESNTMAIACAKIGMHFNTFKRKALELGCYNTNQSGKGLPKNRSCIYNISDILDGKHPEYQTFKLKNRLIKENIKKNECDVCGISEWNGNPINVELDHIDGNSKNHRLENIRMLCPNCHSQTDTFRAKNIRR